MRALITGISGQDGHYAAKALIRRGYDVVGLSSDARKVERIAGEFVGEPVQARLFDYNAPGAIGALIAEVEPDLILNYVAKSTGQGMFDAPLSIGRLNGFFVLEVLEAIRAAGREIGFCQASSAEMYGDVDACPQTEQTCFRPKSPYGAAKLYAHNLVGIYRSAYGLRCSSAILYNHESVRRGHAFVTRKIARAAAAIKLGQQDELVLASIDAERDWGYAPEYAEAMIQMALNQAPADYVVATGRLSSVRDVCAWCFERVGLNYRDYLRIDEGLARPVQTVGVCGDPSAIRRDLGWQAIVPIERVMAEMVDHDLHGLMSGRD